MEAYLTPERVTLLRLMEVAGIEVVEDAPLCRERNDNYAGFTLSTPSTEFIEVINELSAGCCLLYTSPSPRDGLLSRMPSSA